VRHGFLYLCPLTSLIGTVGSMGSVAGFRTLDRDKCLTCKTKDCMRGGEDGYGCPWYTWQASEDSNLYCGLCSECFKACPEGNVGLFLQKPLTSVVTPSRRRADVAWAVALLWGLVLYQQLNATNLYADVDNWLNSALRFPHYPDPIAYMGLILAGAALTAGVVALFAKLLGRRDLAHDDSGGFQQRQSRFRTFFLPIAYGLIPVVGADYFARQLPKFFRHAPRVLPAVAHIFGASGAHSRLYEMSLLSDPRIVAVQLLVIALGTAAAGWAT
jgi:NosR/NirI family nitrous oxide reductase transcriptional regulator